MFKLCFCLKVLSPKNNADKIPPVVKKQPESAKNISKQIKNNNKKSTPTKKAKKTSEEPKPPSTVHTKGFRSLRKETALQKNIKKITIDCTHPVEDGILDIDKFVRFNLFHLCLCFTSYFYICSQQMFLQHKMEDLNKTYNFNISLENIEKKIIVNCDESFKIKYISHYLYLLQFIF